MSVSKLVKEIITENKTYIRRYSNGELEQAEQQYEVSHEDMKCIVKYVQELEHKLDKARQDYLKLKLLSVMERL